MTATYVPDMTKIDTAEQKIGAQQRIINENEGLIKSAVNELIKGSAPLEDAEFWKLIKTLKKEFERTNDNSKLACNRFMWQLVIGTDNKYQAMRFIRTYEEKVGELYKPLFDTIQGFGDDGYGDVLDSFPLFGKTRYEKGLKGEITGSSEEQYQGENYFRMFMEEEFINYYAMNCARAARDEKDDADL